MMELVPRLAAADGNERDKQHSTDSVKVAEDWTGEGRWCRLPFIVERSRQPATLLPSTLRCCCSVGVVRGPVRECRDAMAGWQLGRLLVGPAVAVAVRCGCGMLCYAVVLLCVLSAAGYVMRRPYVVLELAGQCAGCACRVNWTDERQPPYSRSASEEDGSGSLSCEGSRSSTDRHVDAV